MALSFVTSGQSHGPGIVAILSGLPAGLRPDRERLQRDLARRQAGYGRSPRQAIETDEATILGGMRHGRTLGGPLSLIVKNRDHENWGAAQSAWPVTEEELAEVHARRTRVVTVPRPGHADLSGVMKYELPDVRDVLERASARETSARVAVGAFCKDLLDTVGISVHGHVVRVGSVETPRRDDITAREFREMGERQVGCLDADTDAKMVEEIEAAKKAQDTLGGIIEVRAFGDGWDNARLRGSAVHDELRYADGYKRDTNRAGGLEGGMTNGEPVIVRIAMKPLPTLMKPLKTATLDTHEPAEALVERSDTTAIYAAAVVAEAVIAFELARAAHEKFGGDAIGDFIAAHAHYLDRIPWSPA